MPLKYQFFSYCKNIAARIISIKFGFLLCLLIVSSIALAQERETADFVFKNGAVYTVDASRSWAAAVAIKKQRIVYVGSNSGVQEFISNNTKVIDLQGKMMLPGFHDSHVHLITGGMLLSQCNLTGKTTTSEILEAVSRCKKNQPNKKWITGSGWDLTLFKDGNPSKELLDTVISDKPIYLEASDGHSAWVNSKALELAGIGKNTPDPLKGRIERDPKTGLPSGTLRETAMQMVASKIPPPSIKDYREGLRKALYLANSFGITSAQEANASEDLLRTYLEFDQSENLPVRITGAMKFSSLKGEGQIPHLIQLRKTFRSSRLKANAVKIFVDGVIESQTAALLSPYLNKPGYRGNSNYTPEQLTKLVRILENENFQIHVHAIGDRAIRMSLDAFELAQKVNGKRDSRHHIAHLELINPIDIKRFVKLGVVANFQPLWAFADSYITELTEPVLGPKRSRWLYPINSIAKTGAVIVGGSDWSVTSMNPLEAIQVAITRYALDDPKRKAWLPIERVDLPTMIAAYTINGAYLSHQEKEVGSIEVGKKADMIVLDHNLFDIPIDKIHKVKVLYTLVDGAEVFSNPYHGLKSLNNR